jgi:hypothetical protein
MSLIKPIAYFQKKKVGGVVPPAAGIPQEASILLRYEDVNTNGSGTTWTDTSGLGYTSGLLEGLSFIDSTSNSVRLPNTQPTGGSRVARFRVPTTTNMNIKSMVVVFNTYTTNGGTTTQRNYFWDMRKSSATGNGGYFNQVDGVGPGATELFGNDGEYYAYDESDGTLFSAQLTTSANLTNGTNNQLGGSAIDQWLGPNGRSAYLTKRMWLFNFNTNRDLALTTAGARGLVFGCNDNLSEGGTLGIFSVIGWSVALTSSDAQQLVDYYIAEGVLT